MWCDANTGCKLVFDKPVDVYNKTVLFIYSKPPVLLHMDASQASMNCNATKGLISPVHTNPLLVKSEAAYKSRTELLPFISHQLCHQGMCWSARDKDRRRGKEMGRRMQVRGLGRGEIRVV